MCKHSAVGYDQHIFSFFNMKATMFFPSAFMMGDHCRLISVKSNTEKGREVLGVNTNWVAQRLRNEGVGVE